MSTFVKTSDLAIEIQEKYVSRNVIASEVLQRMKIPPKNIRRTRSFYSVLRPVAILAKILGTFPIIGVTTSNGRNLKYKTFSLSKLWGVLLFAAIMSALSLESNVLYDFSKQSTENFWKVTMCIILVARSILQFGCCQLEAGNIPNLFKTLERSLYGNRTQPSIHWKYAPFFILIVELGVIISIDYLYFSSFFPSTIPAFNLAPLFATIRIWQMIPSIMFIGICVLITKSFMEIMKDTKCTLLSLKSIYLSKKNLKETEFNERITSIAEKLETLRLEHGLLQQGTHQLSKCYGLLFAVDYIGIILMMVVALYFSIIYGIDYLFLLSTISNFATGLLIPFMAQRLSDTSQRPLHLLKTVPSLSIREDVRYQISYFQQQIVNHPVEISASGFFNVNNARLVTMLGTVATYLIILLEYGNIIAIEMNEKNK